MGPPLPWITRQNNHPVIKTFFDAEGNWIAEPPIPEASLQDFVTPIICHEWLAGPEPDSANEQ